MAKLKFSIKADERVFLSDKWICNGHWLVKREHAERNKSFDAVKNLRYGTYTLGYKKGHVSDDLPDFEQVIPNREGYEKAEFTGAAKFNPSSFEISSVEVKSEGGSAWIGSRYAELLKLGETWIHATNPTAPIRVEDQGEIVAVVMPVRN